ncbi:MAG TPA: aminopeptidase, partial [Chloroflexota bacterium]|nr:aminopeptidase [Chloroflexota bacterium]
MPESHAFNLPGDTPHYAPDACWRAQHLRLEIAVDPERKRVEGTAAYSLRRAQAGGAAEIELDAAEMEIVEVIGARSWSHSEGTLTIEPESQEAELEVAIRYAAEPQKGMYFLEPDEAYPDRPRQIWTQGQAEDTRYWIPSFDFPNQKLTTELIATVPEHLTVVSNGRLV